MWTGLHVMYVHTWLIPRFMSPVPHFILQAIKACEDKPGNEASLELLSGNWNFLKDCKSHNLTDMSANVHTLRGK